MRGLVIFIFHFYYVGNFYFLFVLLEISFFEYIYIYKPINIGRYIYIYILLGKPWIGSVVWVQLVKIGTG